jgi:hypothetical protein
MSSVDRSTLYQLAGVRPDIKLVLYDDGAYEIINGTGQTLIGRFEVDIHGWKDEQRASQRATQV